MVLDCFSFTGATEPRKMAQEKDMKKFSFFRMHREGWGEPVC